MDKFISELPVELKKHILDYVLDIEIDVYSYMNKFIIIQNSKFFRYFDIYVNDDSRYIKYHKLPILTIGNHVRRDCWFTTKNRDSILLGEFS